jgi:hypothetical protein
MRVMKTPASERVPGAGCPRRRWRSVGVSLLAATGFAAVLPGSASAHVVGTAPVATSFLARINSVPPGMEAKVVDGDQRLWLRTKPKLNALVLGSQGEPYLRFSPAGVAVNQRSPAYYLNRARPQPPPAGLDPRSPPRWHQLTRGHTQSWYEGRMHALAAAARAPGSGYVGQWTIPLLINGRLAQISGGLWHRDGPSIVWFWPIVVVLASTAALVRLRRPRLNAALATGLAAAILLAIAVARAGRDLYGRPTVSIYHVVQLALTLLVILVAARFVLRARLDLIGAVLIGAAGIDVGLTLIGVLLRGFVLSRLPATVERAAIVVALAAGIGLLAVVAFGTASLREAADRRRARAHAPAGG